MKPALVHMLIGAVVGWELGKRYGMALARALRAFSDWVMTKNSLVGLFKSWLHHTWAVVKLVCLGAGLTVVAILVIFVR